VVGDRTDFFVSHAGGDRAWAEWVAWQLTEAGYTVELDVWDWAAGQNFVTAMSDALGRCDRVVALFSAAYFDRSRYTTQEWAVAALQAVGSEEGRLIPVRVEDVATEKVPAILQTLVFRDIFGLAEVQAKQVLLEAVAGPRRPDRQPVFPGKGTPRALSRQGELAPRLPRRMPQVWNIPARNPGFTGRDELLTEVRERLLNGEKAVVQALYGMGGVGKTQVAIEYAYRFARTYDLVWWVPAEQAAMIGDRFAALAAELECAEPGQGTKPVQAAVLRELRSRDGWLLVFDNAEEPGDLAAWLPAGNGHVLITSRRQQWENIATTVEINVLARSESVAILRARVPDLGEIDANRLAERLGDLPLAVAQAAGFMSQTGSTAAEYLDLLETRANEILAEGPLGSYPRSLSAATQLVAEQLADEDPAAAELASLCAFLAPEPIPHGMITSAAAELPAALAVKAADPLAWRRTLTPLTRQALARVDQRGLQLHRLTQAILRNSLPPGRAAATRARAEAVVAAGNPGDPANPGTWPKWALLMPHLLAADLEATDNPALRATASDACWYLLARGDAHSGHDLASRLYEPWRARFGADHQDTLRIANHLGWALWDLGSYAAAKEVAEDTLARRRRVLGEDHPDTLTAATNLVPALVQLGELEEARELAEDTFLRRRRILGEDHPATLFSASNWAGMLRELGRARAARELDEGILARRRLVLGEDHPRTLVSLSNLAADLRELGEVRTARELGADALARLSRVLGEDHPDTLAAARDLAATLRALGQPQDAADLDEGTLARRRRVLGEDHSDTLASASDLAAGLRRLGRYAEARDLDEDTLARRRRVLGEDHPGTLASASDLATDLAALGEAGQGP
jgi:hypothetical protein